MSTIYDKTDNYSLNLYGDNDPADLRDGYNGSMRTIDTTMEQHLNRIESVEARETHDEEVVKALLGDNTVDNATAAKTKWDKASTDAINATTEAATANSKADSNKNILSALGANTMDNAHLLANKWNHMADNSQRRFVVFGDSWTTTLDSVNIPQTAVNLIGATLVKNYGVGGAKIGDFAKTQQTNTTGAQIAAAKEDASIDKNTITDVIVIGGVNNIGYQAYIPTLEQATQDFAGFRMYSNANYWYFANNFNAIRLINEREQWIDWICQFQQGAQHAGFAVAEYSPVWSYDANAAEYWPSLTTQQVHMKSQGQSMWASKMAAFLTGGGESKPFVKIDGITLNQSLTGAKINYNYSIFDGYTVKLDFQVTGITPTPISEGLPNLATISDYTYWPGLAHDGFANAFISDPNPLNTIVYARAATDGNVQIDSRAISKFSGYLDVMISYDIRH